MTDAERDACYRRIEQSLRNAIGTESQPWYDLIAMIRLENARRTRTPVLTLLSLANDALECCHQEGFTIPVARVQVAIQEALTEQIIC